MQTRDNLWLMGWLQERCNKGGDFLITTHYQDKTWSKWKSVLQCWENPEEWWRLDQATNMSSRKCDIFIDIDPRPDEQKVPKSRVKKIINQLKRYDLPNPEIYWTGSRGYHIHVTEPGLAMIDSQYYRENIRRFLMKHLKTDTMLASERHLIAIPNTPHSNTRKPKKLIKARP